MYAQNHDYPSPNFWTPAEVLNFSGHARKLQFLVMHKTEGPLQASIDWLRKKQGASSVSANVVIDHDGTRYYLVDRGMIAWHAYTLPGNQLHASFRWLWGYGNENFDSVGVELVGLPEEPLTEDQYKSAAEYLVECGITADRLHCVEHRELSAVKSDPQDPPHGFDWDKFLGYAADIANPQTGGASSKYFPETKQYVGGGFLGLYNKYGLAVCGLPLTGEYRELRQIDGKSVPVTFQLFENVRMEWRAGTQPRIGALGVDYQKLKGA